MFIIKVARSILFILSLIAIHHYILIEYSCIVDVIISYLTTVFLNCWYHHLLLYILQLQLVKLIEYSFEVCTSFNMYQDMVNEP